MKLKYRGKIFKTKIRNVKITGTFESNVNKHGNQSGIYRMYLLI